MKKSVVEPRAISRAAPNRSWTRARVVARHSVLPFGAEVVGDIIIIWTADPRTDRMSFFDQLAVCQGLPDLRPATLHPNRRGDRIVEF
jgi:hypothetical protein